MSQSMKFLLICLGIILVVLTIFILLGEGVKELPKANIELPEVEYPVSPPPPQEHREGKG